MSFENKLKTISQQLKEIEQLAENGKGTSYLLERSLDSVSAEMKAAQENANFWNALLKINRPIDDLNQPEARRELLKSIADIVKDLLQADIVVIYEGIKEGQFVSPRPGIAGDLLSPAAMEEEIKTSDVVFNMMETDRPKYIIKSQLDPRLTAKRPMKSTGRLRFAIREKIVSTASIPLFIGQERIGILFVNFRHKQEFDKSQCQTIEAVAEQATIALNNVRLLRREIQNRQDLLEILEISKIITQFALDRNLMLQEVVKRIVNIIQVPRGAIAIWDKDGGKIVAEYCENSELSNTLGSRLPEDSYTSNLLQKGQFVKIENIDSHESLSAYEKELFNSVRIKSTLIVPVQVNSQLVATIGIDETRQHRKFTEREIGLCSTLAALVSLSIELSNKVGITKLRDLQQQLLYSFYQEKPDAVFKLILQQGLELINAKVGQLFIVDAEQLVIHASTLQNEVGLKHDIDDSITGLVAKSKKLINLGNLDKDSQLKKLYKPGLGSPMKSELAVPIVISDEVIGVLNAESSQENAFSRWQEELWSILASQAAQSIDLFQRFNEQNAITEIRQEILAQSYSFEELINIILKKARGLIGADIGHLLLEREKEYLEIIASTEEEDLNLLLDINNSVTGLAFKLNQPINIPDLQHHRYSEFHKWYTNQAMRSELAVPMSVRGRVIGVLNVESPKRNAFNKKDERALTNLANEVAIAIELSRQATIRNKLVQIQENILGENESFDLNAIYDQIINLGIDILGSQTGAVLKKELSNSSQEEELIVVASGSSESFQISRPLGTTYKVNNCVSGFAILKRDVINVRDVNSEKPYSDVYQPLGGNMISNIVAPLEVAGEIFGVISFESPNLGEFSEDDETILLQLARIASTAIEKAEFIIQTNIREGEDARERFAIEVTHRLNNPLGAVRVWALEAEEKLKNNQIDKTITAMQQVKINAEKAMKLVDELRWEMRKHQAERIEVDKYFRNFVKEFTSTEEFISSKVAIIDSLNSFNTIILADDLLTRVFENLFQNSIRAIQEKESFEKTKKTIEIGSAIEEGFVNIWVEDSGKGIHPKLLDLIFKESFSTKPKYLEPGNGLGLWWCKNYINAYQGQIKCESDYGQWTKMLIRFPIAF